MNLRKIATALTLVGAATFGSGAHAAPTISNVDGLLTPFGGFDWTSGAAAWTSGFVGAVGSTFTLYYAATAGAITDTGGINLFTPFLDTSANGSKANINQYEYTIFATLSEKVVSCSSATECVFQVTGGSFDIFYDTASNAKQSNGTGYLDGIKIISGSVNPGLGNPFSNLTGGQATLTGSVSYTNSTYIDPVLVGSTLSSTLQLASAVTNFTVPSGFDFDNNGSSTALGFPGVIIFQADANQTFSTAVPEPGSVALVGLGLAGLAFVRRRKSV